MTPRLVSARWCGNHGVLLRYLGNGEGPSLRFVPPNGSLTAGEVAKLLQIYPIQVYRLVDRKVLRFTARKGVARVQLSLLRRYRKTGATK